MTDTDPAEDSPAAFIDRRGGLELLCTIEPSGSRFARLVEELTVSRTTVSKRLREAEELDLIETAEKGDRTSHRYVLTDSGARVRVYLNQRGMTEKYRQLSRLRREFNQQADELQERLDTDGVIGPLSEYSGAKEFLIESEA